MTNDRETKKSTMGGDEREHRRLAMTLAAVLFLGTFQLGEGELKGDYSKLSGIIIPGFASTQLRAWSILDCPYSPLDFNPLDLVWLDTTKLLSAVNCWLKCMLLDPYNQTDNPECKSRPDSGLSAITELDPGYITGAPLLGSTETVKGMLSGNTFGLPVSEGTARLMFNSFGSSLWMMPFSKYCRADAMYLKHFSGGIRKGPNTYQCEQKEFQSNYSGFSTNIINIEIPSTRGIDAYPSVSEFSQTNYSSMECGLPTQLSFSAREISDGTFFKAIEDYDSDSKRTLHQLKKSYHDDPVLNPLTPWDRPPIKNVFCIYGVDSRTEVPYHSLSWCKNWLGPRVNITRAPQSEHDGSDVQVELNVEHHNEDVVPNMTRSPRVKYITYYEDSESIPGKRTAVWELDKANHRNIVRSPALMRELWLQIWHDIHADSPSKFVTKAKRGPLRDDDCYWDYGKARCAWPEYCEYRYVFGDVHLGQSCRLRNSSADALLHYV